ncbi:hypothetical protein [Streptomyces botrytidirepellens]|uniref:Secreted protein n=1 Tax=Streptomyces botrytidirepellens TaxID=2486417 RepID=A0A3M8SAE5_9ACTN|nr:hypothetical protein [Streptomyces botrytidirepellens]RNF77663.1 hypothetical protein EEJ42_49905 [Streptomyces botrytidirepellens]
MNTPLKITAFAVALAATFGAAYGVGDVVVPIGTSTDSAAHAEHEGGNAPNKEGEHGEHTEKGRSTPPGGLQIAENGYSLDLETPRIPAAKKSELRFSIRDSAGRKVTAFKREHDKELHLILASRDLGTFRHLHPTRSPDGTWSTKADLPAAGTYRLFADFTPAAKGAEGLTLGTDLAVSGSYRPAPLPAPAKVAKVDGYTVTLDGRLRPGAASELKLKVAKNGRSVTDLDPYLSAYGHLVALRSGDLAYLHVHPNGAPGDGKTKPGPTISFTATAPSAGTYRLFLDFQHQGKVRTASFTVDTGRSAQEPAESRSPESPEGDHQH